MTAKKAVISATCCIQSGMQFFIAKNGGKEREMSTNKETIRIIANGAEGHKVYQQTERGEHEGSI